jgi:hypothetical protein
MDRMDGMDRVDGGKPEAMPSQSNYAEIPANGAQALLTVACSLLDRQIATLEKTSWKKVVSRSGSTAVATKGELVAKLTENLKRPFFLIASSLLGNKLDCFLELLESCALGSEERAIGYLEVLRAA